jgi:ribosomal protein S18 acetylase RimI-like enzyme
MNRPTPTAGVVAVREATRRDLRATARIHRSHLPDGFFARLGHGFLRRYHATFLASPYAVALVVDDPEREQPAGFLVGTLHNRAHYRWVLRSCAPQLVLRLVLALSCRPRLAWLFLRTRIRRYLSWVRRYPLSRFGRRRSSSAGAARTAAPEPTGTPGAEEAAPAAPVAVLTHVAVDASLRGHGAGRDLVEEFVSRARAAGAGEARLVTETDGGASGFYERLGWNLVGERPGADGAPVHEFQRSLLDAAA